MKELKTKYIEKCIGYANRKNNIVYITTQGKNDIESALEELAALKSEIEHAWNKYNDAMEFNNQIKIKIQTREKLIKSLEQQLRDSEERLKQSALWFYEYEKIHIDKGDSEKAERNKKRAEYCVYAEASAAQEQQEKQKCVNTTA